MLLIVLLAFIIVLAIIHTQCKEKLSRQFIMAFIIYWFLVLGVSTFNPFGLYNVSVYSYILQIIFILSVVIGFSCQKYYDEGRYSNYSISLFGSKTFKVVVAIGIVIVLSMYRFKSQIMSLNDMDSGYFRMDFFEIMFSENPMLLYTYYLFLYPLYFFLMSLVSYSIFFDRNWIRILYYMLYLLPFMSLGEGRMAYMIFGIYLLFSFYIYLEQNATFKISKRIYIIGLLMVATLYLFMAQVTSNRVGTGTFKEGANELNSTIVSYSVLPMRTFDYAVNNDYINKSGGYHLGRASICGFDFLLSSFGKRVGIKFQSVREDTNGLLQNVPVPVSSSLNANYSFTAAIYPYFDFGFIGIIIVPFIFGLFCKNSLIKMQKQFNIYSFALCGFLFFILLHTPFSWYFNKLFTIPYIAFLCYMSSKYKHYEF